MRPGGVRSDCQRTMPWSRWVTEADQKCIRNSTIRSIGCETAIEAENYQDNNFCSFARGEVCFLLDKPFNGRPLCFLIWPLCLFFEMGTRTKQREVTGAEREDETTPCWNQRFAIQTKKTYRGEIFIIRSSITLSPLMRVLFLSFSLLLAGGRKCGLDKRDVALVSNGTNA